MKNRALSIGAIILGVVFVMIAFVYWTTPATLLPSFMPGYNPGMLGVHTKHGVAAFAVAVALFVFAWFTTGKKKESTEDHNS